MLQNPEIQKKRKSQFIKNPVISAITATTGVHASRAGYVHLRVRGTSVLSRAEPIRRDAWFRPANRLD
jgi:hypothetical protein